MENNIGIFIGFVGFFVVNWFIENKTENPRKVYGLFLTAAVVIACIFVFFLPDYKQTPMSILGGSFLALMLKDYLSKKREASEKRKAQKQQGSDPIKEMESRVEQMSDVNEK